MACGIYKLENTGTTSQTLSIPASSLCGGCVGPGNPLEFTINSGETYYVNTSGPIGPFTGIVSSPLFGGPSLPRFNFSSICDNTSFFIYSDPTDSENPFSGISEYYCFQKVVTCNIEEPELFGCYELISTGVTVPGIIQYHGVKLQSYQGASSGDCLNTCPCCDSNFCISDTGYAFDGGYESVGYYNGYPYWSNNSSTYFIYYSSSEDSWCLSSSLGGTCELFGPSPCFSNCPDLCDDILLNSVCPTPTPTPTINCDVFDFSATFDCLVTPTPSVSPTPTITPTPTPTNTPNLVCSGISVDSVINEVSATPTPTPTITPTSSPIINRDCEFIGDVSFNLVNTEIKCALSKEFKDCQNQVTYYTTTTILTPSGDTLEPDMIFIANIGDVKRCIYYVGDNYTVAGVSTISLTDGPIGVLDDGVCTSCPPPESPTPTPTPTISPTPTTTPTPTPSTSALPACKKYQISVRYNNNQPILVSYATINFNGCCANINQTQTTIAPPVPSDLNQIGEVITTVICSTTLPTVLQNINTTVNIIDLNTLCTICEPPPVPCVKYFMKNLDEETKTFNLTSCCGSPSSITISPNTSQTYCSSSFPTTNAINKQIYAIATNCIPCGGG